MATLWWIVGIGQETSEDEGQVLLGNYRGNVWIVGIGSSHRPGIIGGLMISMLNKIFVTYSSSFVRM